MFWGSEHADGEAMSSSCGLDSSKSCLEDRTLNVSLGGRNVTQGEDVRTPLPKQTRRAFSFIRTMTVGSGLSPDLLTLLDQEGARGLATRLHTAGRDFHPALRTLRIIYVL